MDEICLALLTKINSLSVGNYVIFYEDELIDVIANDSEKNRETLEAALKKLVNCGCIDVKYARNSTFCIAWRKSFTPAPKPTPQFIGGSAPATRNANSYKTYAITALFSFLGGTIGSIIAGTIFALALR
jgi:hypothetical protein